MAGLSRSTSGDAVQAALGTIARDVHAAISRIDRATEFLAANDDAALLSLYGISGGDAAILRSAIADLAQLQQVYRGQVAVTPAKDFRTFVARIAGLGF